MNVLIGAQANNYTLLIICRTGFTQVLYGILSNHAINLECHHLHVIRKVDIIRVMQIMETSLLRRIWETNMS